MDQQCQNVSTWGEDPQPQYPPFPVFADRADGETDEQYAVRAFGFILSERQTASVPDRALELVIRACQLTARAQDRKSVTGPRVLDTMDQIERQCSDALRTRA